MRFLVIRSAVALAIVGVASTPAVALMPAGDPVTKAAVSYITSADYSHRRHYSHVRAPRYSREGRVPRHLRGFEDPGYAYHGNINGCVIDQGYGRWAPCSSGR